MSEAPDKKCKHPDYDSDQITVLIKCACGVITSVNAEAFFDRLLRKEREVKVRK